MSIAHSFRQGTAVLLCGGALLGCKAGPWLSAPIDNVTPLRTARQATVQRQFNEDRDAAELQAALASWQLGDLSGCETRLESMLARGACRQSASLLLAESNFLRGEDQAAGNLLREAVLADANDEELRLQAALLMLRYSQPRLAVELLEQPPFDTTASPAIMRALGTAHYRCGDYLAAHSVLEDALRLDNTSALSYFLMGCAEARLGRRAAAEAAFAQAARLDSAYAAAR